MIDGIETEWSSLTPEHHHSMWREVYAFNAPSLTGYRQGRFIVPS
jgi:hypothetical protein